MPATTMQLRRIIETANSEIDSMPTDTGWQTRHRLAWRLPTGPERPIVAMFQAIADYGDTHELRFASTIGDDGFLGPLWFDMVKSLRGMLNGDCGRLDCGTLDRILCRFAESQGFNIDG